MCVDLEEINRSRNKVQKEAIAHQSQYYVSGTRLMREYGYDGQIANIASYISQAEFSIDVSGRLITFTLTSSPESIAERSETKTYRFYQRTEGG